LQTATMRKTLRGCHLSKDDLVHLLGVVVRGMGDDPNVRLEVRREIASVDATTLEALLIELQNPSKLDNLSIWVSGGNRSTSVALEDGLVHLRVQGEDETWVRGRFDELQVRLTASRKLPVLAPDFVFFSGLALVMLPGEIVGAFTGWALGLGAGSLALAVVLPVGLWLQRRGKSVVILEEPTGVAARPDAFTITIGVLSVVLTLVGLWISWQAWKHPVS
jgi:hypothetical protein